MVGQTLKNGAVVLQSKNTDAEEVKIVLCIFNNEFVTWVYDTVTGICSFGHYFKGNELEISIKSFKERT